MNSALNFVINLLLWALIALVLTVAVALGWEAGKEISRRFLSKGRQKPEVKHGATGRPQARIA